MEDKQFLAAVQTMTDTFNARFETMENNLAALNHNLTILIENNHNDICRLLKEDYSPIREKVSSFEDYPETKQVVKNLEHASQNHNERLEKLEKTAI